MRFRHESLARVKFSTGQWEISYSVGPESYVKCCKSFKGGVNEPIEFSLRNPPHFIFKKCGMACMYSDSVCTGKGLDDFLGRPLLPGSGLGLPMLGYHCAQARPACCSPNAPSVPSPCYSLQLRNLSAALFLELGAGGIWFVVLLWLWSGAAWPLSFA